MALDLDRWNKLPLSDKNSIVSFLTKNCRIDRELPAASLSTPNSYSIADGTTSGGYPMKFGEEYRIYVKDISNIHPFLDAELKDRGTKNRIGGSEAIKAIMDYGNFKVGNN